MARRSRAELSEREAELLRYLAANAGRAVAREELLANVWRIPPHGVSTRTIDMHVTRLREKLRDDPAEPKVLLTVRGKGYMFRRQWVVDSGQWQCEVVSGQRSVRNVNPRHHFLPYSLP